MKTLAVFVLALAAAPKDDPWVVYEGGEGPGKGKHVVLISGDEEYRSEEALPQLGKILAKRHGFKCTVLFAINKQTGMLEGVPDVITRGFVMQDAQTLLADAARALGDIVEQASLEERTDQGLIKEKLRVELRRFFRKRSGRRPFVLPVIMEI